jgi:hypothetical protein
MTEQPQNGKTIGLPNRLINALALMNICSTCLTLLLFRTYGSLVWWWRRTTRSKLEITTPPGFYSNAEVLHYIVWGFCVLNLIFAVILLHHAQSKWVPGLALGMAILSMAASLLLLF